MKKCLILLVTIIMTASVMGCAATMNYTIGSVGNATATEKSMTYEEFQGKKEYKIKIGSEGATILVNIVSESGTLAASIINDADETDIPYDGKELQTGSFSVNIKEEGTYCITLTANHHKGSYSFLVTDLSEDTDN